MPSALFSPIKLAGLTVPNRIVVSPMCQYSANDGVGNDWHMTHLGMLANSGAGLLVVEATESLASPVSWSHHFIWMVLLVAWLALAEDRPRAGEWWALAVAVLLWAAPYWWVPHGPAVRFAGRGWLLPLGNAYVLVFIVLLAADRGGP